MTPPPAPPLLGVALVNWNRWQDTIECLESLLRSTVPVHAVVVDNASADGSAERIAAWARGELGADAGSPAMAHLSQPPLAKPIAMQRLAADDIDRLAMAPGTALTLIDAGGNLGFAGGNNLALRWLMRDARLDLFWLLNNDTVVEPDAAAALVAAMHAAPDIGMCGTVVRFYHRPTMVQALNGSRFNWWTGQSSGIGSGETAAGAVPASKVAQQTDFVLGASLAVSRPFVDSIGLMEEGYFLYFEEIDWAARNRGRFRIGFAGAATVFHKEGSSIGSSSTRGGRSAFSDYWLARSRLRFIGRHRPLLLPLHMLLTIGIAARRLLRAQPANAAAMMRALRGAGY